MEEQNSIKVVLLGEVGVGKTSIIKQFAYQQFDNESITTTYASFATKKMEFKDYGAITFDIWDTAGQEKYRSITSIFYNDAKVIILVYDITNNKSFDEIQNYWYEQIKLNCEDAILAVVANKSDLYEIQTVQNKTGEVFAENIGAIFQSTSAVSNESINKLFEHIGKKIINPDYDYKKADIKAYNKSNRKIKKGKENDSNENKNITLGDVNENIINEKRCCYCCCCC